MGFWQFLTLLPKLIDGIIKLHQYMKDKEVERWLSELDEVTESLKGAKNVEDKRAAAIKLASLVRKL